MGVKRWRSWSGGIAGEQVPAPSLSLIFDPDADVADRGGASTERVRDYTLARQIHPRMMECVLGVDAVARTHVGWLPMVFSGALSRTILLRIGCQCAICNRDGDDEEIQLAHSNSS